MTPTAIWLMTFVLLFVAALGAMFLYGWKRRNEKMPDVPPLPPEDDDWK